MSGIQHNAPAVARRYRNASAAIRAEVGRTLTGLAARMAAEMRRRAPKFRSTLTNSVRVDRESELSLFVGPHVDYDVSVEKGRKPGKGLPRFFDPAAASAVAWLQANPRVTSEAGPVRPPTRPGRIGSRRRQAEELDLRDRYMALSRHVKFKGLEASPFVKPTADAFRPVVGTELLAAVQRGARLFAESRAT